MRVSLPRQYHVNLHILSPIHIGTGEELDPFGYVVREQTLLLIDLLKWFDNSPQKDHLASVMASGDFAESRTFIAENFDDPAAVRFAIPVLSDRLLITYDKAIRNKDPKNQVLISPTTRHPISAKPYIPGSSIKGSVRTAIANRFVKAAGVTSRDAKGREDYNRKIFGAIGEDPMRWLKVSDIPLESTATAIFEAKEFSSNPAKPLTPKNYVEAIIGLTHVGRRVSLPLRLQMAPFEMHRHKIDPGFIIDALNDFYIPKYAKEYQTFYGPARSNEIRHGVGILNSAVKSLKSHEALIRIGHFSHVECITLDDVRTPQTKKGKDGRPLPWGTTRTLANGIFPFGWAILEFKDLEGRMREIGIWASAIEELPMTDGLPQKIVNLETRVRQAIESLGETSASVPTSGENVFVEAESKEQRFVRKNSHTLETAEPVQKDSEQQPASKLERLLSDLYLIAPQDMGRLGTIIQKIEDLDSEEEKAVIAKTIQTKIGKKAFKKHKRREYLIGLIEKGSK